MVGDRCVAPVGLVEGRARLKNRLVIELVRGQRLHNYSLKCMWSSQQSTNSRLSICKAIIYFTSCHIGTSLSWLPKNMSRGRAAGKAGLSSSSCHRSLFLPIYYQSYSAVASRTRVSSLTCIAWSWASIGRFEWVADLFI